MRIFIDEERKRENGISVLEMLYTYYRENCTTDTEEIRPYFQQLDGVLRGLPLSDVDMVWNLTCDLCIAHQRTAFLDGIIIGIHLMQETAHSFCLPVL